MQHLVSEEVSAMCGAQCNTDHLRISNQVRFDVSKLKEHVVGSHGRATAMQGPLPGNGRGEAKPTLEGD